MRRLLTSGIAVVLLVTGVLTTPTAAADPVDETIAFDCSIPISGNKTVSAEVEANIPTTGQVGVPVELGVQMIVSFSNDVFDSVTPFGATQFDGTADSGLVVTQSDGSTIDLPFQAMIPPTPISPGSPTSIPFGSPFLVFTPTVAGVAIVGLYPNLTLQVTPRDADGNPTILGTLDIPCTTTGDTTLGTVSIS